VAYADSSRPEEASAPPQQDVPRKKKVVVLGTGWGGTSFLKNLDCSRYDVKVISPRNYFAFTPLLPSVTCGTVEARSIVEPIRRMFEKVLGLAINLMLLYVLNSVCATVDCGCYYAKLWSNTVTASAVLLSAEK
jgi:hypothetical protein